MEWSFSSASKLFSAIWLCWYSRYHWLIFKDPIESRHKVIAIGKYSNLTLTPSSDLRYYINPQNFIIFSYLLALLNNFGKWTILCIYHKGCTSIYRPLSYPFRSLQAYSVYLCIGHVYSKTPKPRVQHKLKKQENPMKVIKGGRLQTDPEHDTTIIKLVRWEIIHLKFKQSYYKN